MTHTITEKDVNDSLQGTPVYIASSSGERGSKRLIYLPAADVFHVLVGGEFKKSVEGDNVKLAVETYNATLEG